MLQHVKIPEPGDLDSPLSLEAEGQCWDDATLQQLRDEYHIFFMTSGDGVTPVMVIGTDSNPLIAIGSEDDGLIRFERRYGHYRYISSSYWIPYLIADLEAAKQYCDGLMSAEKSDA